MLESDHGRLAAAARPGQPRARGRQRIGSQQPVGPGQRHATRPGRYSYGPGVKAHGRHGHSSPTCRTAGPATVGKNRALRAPGNAPRATTPETRVHRQPEVTPGPGGRSPGESVAEAAGTTRPAAEDRLGQAALRRGATAELTLGAAVGAALPVQTDPWRPARRVHWGRQHRRTGRTRHSIPAVQAQPAAGRRAPAETGAKNIPSSDCRGRRDHRGVRCISVQSRSGLGTGRCLRRFGGGRPGRPEDQKYLKN